jgi:hypothetical protein
MYSTSGNQVGSQPTQGREAPAPHENRARRWVESRQNQAKNQDNSREVDAKKTAARLSMGVDDPDDGRRAADRDFEGRESEEIPQKKS